MYNCELCGHKQEKHYMHKVHNLVVCKSCTPLADRLDVACFTSSTVVSLPGLAHVIVIEKTTTDHTCTVYANEYIYATRKNHGVKTYHTTHMDALRYGVLGLLSDYYTLRVLP